MTDPQASRSAVTEAVLELFTDEMSLAYTVARGWMMGGGTENERDATKYVEGAAQALLVDGGQTARAMYAATGRDPATDTAQDVLSEVDWETLGNFFWRWYLDGGWSS